jgi:biotin carboxylase
MNEPWLVAVCAGRWQLHGIRSARRCGLRVLALDGDPAAPGFREADRSMVVDVLDPEAVISAVERCGIQPAGAISLVSEAGMVSAAALRERFDLPGPRMDVTLALTNKALQRELWQKAGLPGPAWRLAGTEAEIKEALKHIGRPAIIKPVDSAGSRGVTKIEPGDPWEPVADLAFSHSRARKVLVESYLPGLEHTVETFSISGQTYVLAVTEKAKVPETGGTVAMELATPASREQAANVAQVAVKALAALGYSDGPGHTEVMMGPDGHPGLIESAGRGGGFMVFDGLIPEASGFDVAMACVLQAVGRPTPPVSEGRKAVVLRFFPSRPGIVRSMEGFEEANRIAGVRAGPFVTVGSHQEKVRGDGDRLGYILAAAAEVPEARRLADWAQSIIRFDIERELVDTIHH